MLTELDPTYLVLENVGGILDTVDDTDHRVIDDVEAALTEIGYAIAYRLVDCQDYGIPQKRERVLLLGVREEAVVDAETTLESLLTALDNRACHTEPVTIRQALSNLPIPRRGEGARVTACRRPGRASAYVRTNSLGDVTRLTYNHRARSHPMAKDRELFDEVLEPGMTGWEVKYEQDRPDLIDYNVGSREQPAFKDKYRMLHWDHPSPTIVAHLKKDANSFVLPDYYDHVKSDPERADAGRNRGITPREAARIQSFPDSFVFLGPFTAQFQQIGNAVPPVLAREVGEILLEHLNPSKAPQVEPLQSPSAADD
jgi:DNA (cytosine-5)-methyltransferase 1